MGLHGGKLQSNVCTQLGRGEKCPVSRVYGVPLANYISVMSRCGCSDLDWNRGSGREGIFSLPCRNSRPFGGGRVEPPRGLSPGGSEAPETEVSTLAPEKWVSPESWYGQARSRY